MDTAILIVSSLLLVGLGMLIGRGLHLLFRDTLNRVQYYPFHTQRSLYWITRDTDSAKWGKSFMRMTSYPWLRGSGYTIKLPNGRSFQVGIATRYTYEDEQEALRAQLGARDMDIDVETIRKEFKRGTTQEASTSQS